MRASTRECLTALCCAFVVAGVACAGDARIVVDAGETVRSLSRYLTGACIEDVNHEVYGGIYSQMVFGESFQEPAPLMPMKGFTAFGGMWRVGEVGELWGSGGDGPKLVSAIAPFARGEVSVELLLGEGSGNAGLIVKVGAPAAGADRFVGYEVSLDTAQQVLRLGRHRQNWEHIKDVPCAVPAGKWIELAVAMTATTLDVRVDSKPVVHYEDREHPLETGSVGLRQWQREARYRNLRVTTGGATVSVPFEHAGDTRAEVSGMWRAVQRGSAEGLWALEKERPCAGTQSQRIAFTRGEGAVGIENQSLNRWGMSFLEGKTYEGYLWVRAETAAHLSVSLESRDGAKVYADAPLSVAGNEWQRLAFTLTANATDPNGRFAIRLTKPGSVVVGHAFLQPGEWGRFKGLPLRKDVVEALIDQGITVLRYGGSMINHPEYRWKKMLGPRDKRPPYCGTWYPYSSNGWGIIDFLNLCEAAGFLAIPAFNMGETPADMADFVEYVNGPADSTWGRSRVADGHPVPYNLRHIELGNEERVDAAYFEKFKPLAEAIWAADAQMTIVVGDFVYSRPIVDPFKFDGAASGITALTAHEMILALAKTHDREVWFDLHVTTEVPGRAADVRALPTFIEALAKVSGGAKHKVAIFEFNAGNHRQKRALSNAQAILITERLGLPVVTSANCLQCDGQNDNGWDQGLLFLNPSQVWLQPPGYVTRMTSRNYEPLLVRCNVEGGGDLFDANATRSEDGKTLVLKVVNGGESAVTAAIELRGFVPGLATAVVEELSAPLDARNSAEDPRRYVPTQREWRHEFKDGVARLEFKPFSYTVVRLR